MKSYKLPSKLTPFQEKMYKHLIELNGRSIQIPKKNLAYSRDMNMTPCFLKIINLMTLL